MQTSGNKSEETSQITLEGEADSLFIAMAVCSTQ